ncbi:hypothetical protein [Streptomyces cyaneofuscatus]
MRPATWRGRGQVEADGEARAGLDTLTGTFRRQEGAAAVGGELLLEVRQLVTELGSA